MKEAELPSIRIFRYWTFSRILEPWNFWSFELPRTFESPSFRIFNFLNSKVSVLSDLGIAKLSSPSNFVIFKFSNDRAFESWNSRKCSNSASSTLSHSHAFEFSNTFPVTNPRLYKLLHSPMLSTRVFKPFQTLSLWNLHLESSSLRFDKNCPHNYPLSNRKGERKGHDATV